MAQIRSLCLAWLARREHSRQELLTKLVSRSFARSDSLAVLDELSQQGWQDDNRYAESYARSRIRKGFGPVAIGFELNRNGIADVDLDAMAETEAGGWRNVMLGVYQKKYHQPPATAKEWAGCGRFLLQRGFPATLVKQLLDELKNKRPSR